MSDRLAKFQRAYNSGGKLLEELLLSFGEKQQNRFLQNLPIRVSVWRVFAEDPIQPVNLLLTPNYRVSTNTATTKLRRTLLHRKVEARDCQLIALSNCIHIHIALREFLFAILPQSYWWHKSALPMQASFERGIEVVVEQQDLRVLELEIDKSEDKAIWTFFAAWAVIDLGEMAYQAKLAELGNSGNGDENLQAKTARWESIAANCDLLLRLWNDHTDSRVSCQEIAQLWDELLPKIIQNFAELKKAVGALSKSLGVSDPRRAPIWSVDLNRPVDLAIATSRLTIKADAAQEVFGDRSEKIRWAIVDSGIDATHPAFQDRAAPVKDAAAARAKGSGKKLHSVRLSAENSRILATYDFNRLLPLFTGSYRDLLPAARIAELERLVNSRSKKISKPESLDVAILMDLYRCNATDLRQELSTQNLKQALQDKDFAEEVTEYIGDIKRLVTEGRTIDWPLVLPLLRIPHGAEFYKTPENAHGTHVAGILGSELKMGELTAPSEADGEPMPRCDMKGVCPKIKLYDLRVCDDHGKGDEFLILAALQFIAYLNRDRDQRLVHGANISLSLKHEVRNYACGQTPVCREAERLVGNGTVVVVAAGNLGFQRLSTENGLIDTYNAISITDPGNAEAVITVGSTYRERPHTYGVSYFSSRGPTGDGRQKPDLVAPGEKIWAPTPRRGIDDLNGTSMAAPHVSGAAALLMARHNELIGNPQRVKEILCETATDLGRKAEFQGYGLVDVLRALQSV